MNLFGIIVGLLLVNILAFLVCYSCLGKEGLLIFGVFGAMETFFLLTLPKTLIGSFEVIPNVCVILLLFGGLALMFEKFGKESAFEYIIVVLLSSLFAICIESFASLPDIALFNIAEVLTPTIITFVLLCATMIFFVAIWDCFERDSEMFLVKLIIGMLCVTFFWTLLYAVMMGISGNHETVIEVLKAFLLDWVVQLIIGIIVVAICVFFNSQDSILLELDERGSNDYRIDYKYRAMAEQAQKPEKPEAVEVVKPVEEEKKIEIKKEEPIKKTTPVKKTTTTKKPSQTTARKTTTVKKATSKSTQTKRVKDTPTIKRTKQS